MTGVRVPPRRPPPGDNDAMANQYTDTAQSIVEHAEALSRLDSRGVPADDYARAVDVLVHAMRVLGVSHVDPWPDRAFLKELRQRAAGVPGVSVHMEQGAIELIVDAVRQQHVFRLWNAKQLRDGEE